MVNQVLASLRLAKHPDKTLIGRIAKGFDFLGYHFRPDGRRVATKTVANFVARVRQLFEHEPGEGVSARLGAYVRRWVQWVTAGVAVSQLLLSVLAWAEP
jgi:RNA-directed DNA polymerase